MAVTQRAQLAASRGTRLPTPITGELLAADGIDASDVVDRARDIPKRRKEHWQGRDKKGLGWVGARRRDREEADTVILGAGPRSGGWVGVLKTTTLLRW